MQHPDLSGNKTGTSGRRNEQSSADPTARVGSCREVRRTRARPRRLAGLAVAGAIGLGAGAYALAASASAAPATTAWLVARYASASSGCIPGAAGCSSFNFTVGHWGQPVIAKGEVYFKATNYRVQYAGQQLLLAGDPSGSADINVDDVLALTVRHSNGTTATYKHDFSNNCSGTDTAIPPVNVSSLFSTGANQVTATLSDKCGGGEGPITGLWIVFP